MKKAFVAALSAACSLVFVSCGPMGTTPAASTPAQSQQVDGLGGLLSGLTGIGDILSGALGISTTSIVGTWVYQGPAVVFESDNLLTKAGGQIAAQNMATKMDGYFQKVGIKPGKMSMTFDKQGKFTQTIGGKTQSGTYKVEKGVVNLTYAGGHNQIFGTTQFDGNNLVIVVDMTKLMNLAQTISAVSGNSTLSALSQLSQGVTGMKAGLKFKKQ